MIELRQSYIISGNTAYNKAIEIAREATGTKKQNCPDIITVYREKTELTVNQVRDVVADSAVLPNESNCKVYIFADGDYMNVSAQNALLKLLEEPPRHVILILCAMKPDVFLPTVRSRCVELSSYSDADEDYELAEEFLRSFSKGLASRIKWLEENNKMSIPECEDFCLSTCRLITDILCSRHESYSINEDDLIALEKELEKCLTYLKVNVNVKQIFGLLEIF